MREQLTVWALGLSAMLQLVAIAVLAQRPPVLSSLSLSLSKPELVLSHEESVSVALQQLDDSLELALLLEHPEELAELAALRASL